MKRSPLFLCLIAAALAITLPFTANADCSVSQRCVAGGSVSCTGSNGTCSTTVNSVSCNGSSYYCPGCSTSVQCAYGGFIQCSTENGQCQAFADSIACSTTSGINYLTCDECYPAILCSSP